MSNTIDWGKIHYNSWSPETNLTGAGATPSYQNEYSFQFDGIDDYIDCGSFSAYDNGDLSASIWIKKSTMGIYEYALSNSGSSVKAGFDIVFENQFRRVSIGRRTRTSDVYSGFLDIGFTLNTWHNIAFTYKDSTRTLKVYMDGVLQSTTIGSASTNSASSNLIIGSYQGASNFCSGNIDEVSIFNTELSASDITTIYNSGVPNNLNDLSTPPLSWWQMGEAATFDGIRDWNLVDQGTGGNDATSQNIAETERVTDVPT